MSYNGSASLYFKGDNSPQIPALFAEWVKSLPVEVSSSNVSYYFNEDKEVKEQVRKEDTKPAKAG